MCCLSGEEQSILCRGEREVVGRERVSWGGKSYDLDFLSPSCQGHVGSDL